MSIKLAPQFTKSFNKAFIGGYQISDNIDGCVYVISTGKSLMTIGVRKGELVAGDVVEMALGQFEGFVSRDALKDFLAVQAQKNINFMHYYVTHNPGASIVCNYADADRARYRMTIHIRPITHGWGA